MYRVSEVKKASLRSYILDFTQGTKIILSIIRQMNFPPNTYES